MNLAEFKNGITGIVFLGDESHVIFVTFDGYLRILRISDGVQTAHYKCRNVRLPCRILLLLTIVSLLPCR